MKKAISVVLALLMLCTFSVPAFAANQTPSVYSSYSIPSGTMRMIAHSGYAAVAPENTLAAYRAAGASDFWGAECDIHRTKDGVWILMHDDTVDRMTDGTGAVSEMTYDEIRALRIDAGSNIENYPDEKVPTLSEYLDVCKEFGLHPVIEIKAGADPDTLDEVAAILDARAEKDMCVVISFGREICVRMKELMPALPVYYLIGYEDVTQEDIDFAADNGLDGMDIHVYLPDDYVKAVQAAGLDIIVWTIDDIDNANRFYKLGVTAITTNSLTQEEPEGNGFQRLLWKLRDFFYQLKLRLRAFFRLDETIS